MASFQPLRARTYYPPLPEAADTRAANRAENERLRALSLKRKEDRAARAKRNMLRQQGLLSDESEDEDVEDDGGDDDAGDDDDDDGDDDLGDRYAAALGLGKRSAAGSASEPGPKRPRVLGQGTSGEAPGSGGDAPSSAEGAARMAGPVSTVGVEPPAPPAGAEPPQPIPAAALPQVEVAPPAVTPVRVETLATPPPARVSVRPAVGADPFLRFITRSSR
jgi:hypothetical protein